MIPAKFRDAHEAHIRRFGATGETTRAMGSLNAVSGLRSNGEEFPIEASISQIEAEGQKLFTVILRDITERVHANERLIEQARLLDQSHEAIIVRDLESRIRYWSRGAERLYGWTAEEAVGRSGEELHYRNEPSLLAETTRMTVENGMWNGELRHITKDGRKVIVQGHWTLVRDAEGKPKSILAINTDITEKKKLEAQFLRAQRLENIGTLASGIAHDLNNVLSPISMGAQMLQMKLKDQQSQRLAHGSGSSRHSPRNQYVAQIIREAGVGTLLFDLLTHEEERIDLQTRHLRFDIPLLARRLVAATVWINSQPPISRLQIGYFGASTGGCAALIAAAQLGREIGAVVSRGGRPDLAGAALSQVLAPTLLIVGGLDEVVIRLNEEALAQLQCVKELKIVPGATHLFEEPGKLEEVARLAADWFQRYLH